MTNTFDTSSDAEICLSSLIKESEEEGALSKLLLRKIKGHSYKLGHFLKIDVKFCLLQ